MTLPGTSARVFDVHDARRMVGQINEQGGTYHRLDFGAGLVIDGDYDMAKYLPHYHLPERLDGMTVLDVGTASGFFAIECERRGAKVTAIDIWDDNCLLVQLSRAFGLEINYVTKNIYELDSSFGGFDLVICGSLLLHLPDPVGAIRALRKVADKRLILSTAAVPESATTDQPVCHFFGQRAADGDYWSYWGFSAQALERMALAAGFSRVDNIEHFDLRSEPGRTPFSTPHVALSALD